MTVGEVPLSITPDMNATGQGSLNAKIEMIPIVLATTKIGSVANKTAM